MISGDTFFLEIASVQTVVKKLEIVIVVVGRIEC
jgi:hypothetical protein